MKRPITTKVARGLNIFRKSEEGSITVLTLFLIIAMVWISGIAVDMMRFETYRARLQSTIDRATLAAADLETCRDADDPADIVRDYMAKNGFQDQLGAVTVVRDAGSCEVSAEATINVNTIFMEAYYIDADGERIDQLGTTAMSAATESIDDVEISLVLDVSGSMGRNGRITQLRTAASDFVETIHDAVEDEERLSISIVPYSTQVNIGPDLYSQYRTRYNHDYSYCLDLPVSTYDTTSIDPTVRYDQSAHFDANSSFNWNLILHSELPDFRMAWTCNPAPESWVLPFNNDVDRMQDHIAALTPSDWTSIEMGANWGVALLDPQTQPIAQGLSDDGAIDPVYANRPLPFDPDETLKVLVMMTDGENTRDYVLSTSHRQQWSDVWFAWNMEYAPNGTFIGDPWPYATSTAALSVDPVLRGVGVEFDENNSAQQFFVRDREPSDRDGDGVSQEWHFWVEGRFEESGGTLVRDDSPPVWSNPRFGARQQWQDVWARFPVRTHAFNFRYDQIEDASQYYSWYDNLVTITYTAEKDRRLDLVCDAAKEEGIIIFTIGFEVTDRAAAVMSQCASSPNHFYRVNGLEIGTAFSSIANQISALRLFQ